MHELRTVTKVAQTEFAALISRAIESGGVSMDAYARFLRMEHYLTRDVQQRFYQCAGASAMKPYPAIREFLVSFANEEAPHHQDAIDDLASMGSVLGSEPLDVALYHSFWRQWPPTRPFFRLGSTCVVENISGGDSSEKVLQVISSFRSKGLGVKFATDHAHVELKHGDGIVEVLERAALSESDYNDLVAGARIGAVMYLRMIKWCLQPDELDIFSVDLPSYACSYPAESVEHD